MLAKLLAMKTRLLSSLTTTPCAPRPVISVATTVFRRVSITETVLSGTVSVPWLAT